MSTSLREKFAPDRLLGVAARIVGVLALSAYPLVHTYDALMHSSTNNPAIERLYLPNSEYQSVGSSSLAGMAVEAYLHGRDTGKTTWTDISKNGTKLDSVYQLTDGTAASISVTSTRSTVRDGLVLPDPAAAKRVAFEIDDSSGNSQSIKFTRNKQSDGPWTITRVSSRRHSPDQQHEVMEPVGGRIDSITKFIMRGETVVGEIDVDFDPAASTRAYNKAALDAAYLLKYIMQDSPNPVLAPVGSY